MNKVQKIIQQIKTNKWIHYVIIIVIGIILSIPLSQIQLRDTHDGSLHLLRILGTENTFKIGEIPPIVAPYFCNNGGYAMNLFYNPLVTYIPLLIKLVVGTYALALKIFAGICITLSGITMYKFVETVTKNKAISLFSAIAYMIAPYKLVDVYIRFAIGEFAAFVFMPILFIGIYNLFNGDKKKHYFIAIGATGLLLTHTVTTFYMAILCVIYILFNIKKLKEKDVIKKIFINGAFILLISAFFLLPMLEAKATTEYPIFDDEIMATNANYVSGNTIDISEFFVDKWALISDDKKACSFVIGVPIFVLFILTIFTYKKVDKKYKDFYILSLMFSIISLYMATKYCPWMIFPNFLCKLQYPWRMIGFFNFFSAFAVGVNMYILIKWIFKKDLSRLIATLILIVAMVGYTLPIILQYKTDDNTKDEKYEKQNINNPYVYHLSINREYLPKKALLLQRTYLKERKDKIYVLQGNANIVSEEKKDLENTAKIENVEKGTILEMPFFYYPGYEITLEINGEKTILKTIESDNGFVACEILEDVEQATISTKYVGTKLTKISYIISLISLIIFITYIILEKRKENNV